MTRVSITVDVADEYADPEHPMGITDEAYERLTGFPVPLAWLGEVEDVVKVEA